MTNESLIQDISGCYKFENELFKAFSFIPFGLSSSICNGILIVAILSSSQLRVRHEIQVICALSIADFLEAFATLCGGIYRCTIISMDLKDVKFQPWQCMLLPHSWLWRWSDFATSFMLLTLTFDRLLSVVLPVKYITWGSTYTYLAIGTPYAISVLLSLPAWKRPLTNHEAISMLCMNVYISPRFYAVSKYFTGIASTLSIVFYIPVVILIKIQMKHLSRVVCSAQTIYQRKAQMRMTMTLAFSCFATFVLDAIPRAVGILGNLDDKGEGEMEIQCESAMQMLFHLTKVNSIVSLMLYYHRNSAIRDSIRNVLHLTCIRKKSTVIFAHK